MTNTDTILRELDAAAEGNRDGADMESICYDASLEIRRLEKHRAITEAVIEALEEISEWHDVPDGQKAEVREILTKLRGLL